jgi:hypothetical protein
LIALAAAFLLVVIGCAVLFPRWHRGRGGAHFMLAAVPMALLLATASVPFTAWNVIHGFRTLARQGTGVVPEAIARLTLAMDRGLFIGTIGCLIVVAVSAAMQFAFGRAPRVPNEPIGQAVEHKTRWEDWFLVLSALLVLPVAFLTQLAQGLARFVTVTAIEYARADGAARSAEELTQTTSTIASGLIFTVVLGASLGMLLLLVCVSSILFVTTRRATDRFRTFAWGVYAVVAVAATWNALRLSIDARWIQFAVR